MNRKLALYLLAFAVVLVLLAGTCLLRMLDARAAAELAKADVLTTSQLAHQIRTLRAVPAVASASGNDAVDFSHALNEALATADLDADYLVSVTPNTPSRVGNTNYEQRPIRIKLRSVTLAQALDLMAALERDHVGLSVSGVTLTTDAQNLWSLDLTVAALTYRPTT